MKNGIKLAVSFCFGGLIGGLISHKILKKKFENRLTAELESVKSTYEGDKKVNVEKKLLNDVEADAKLTSGNNACCTGNQNPEEVKQYVDYTKCYKPSEEKPEVKSEKKSPTKKKQTKKKEPYVISPDDFDTNADYEAVWLTLYADDILADEKDQKVDIEKTIGSEALNRFGEYEKDIVHVRNEELKCDYEVSRDTRTYKQVIGDDDPDDNEDGRK